MTTTPSSTSPIASVVALAFALLIAGCSGVKPAAPVAPPPPSAAEAVVPAAKAPAAAPPPSTTEAVVPAAKAPAATPPPNTTEAVVPAAKAPAATPPKAAVPEAPKKPSTAPEVAGKASPTLDLKSLEQRLKDTSAIGVLTKIALKNQVDDLLDQFRAFYQGKLKASLSDLRHSYDLLVLKVLSLLQDSDPSLASAIVTSREAIWSILADPAKFSTI